MRPASQAIANPITAPMRDAGDDPDHEVAAPSARLISPPSADERDGIDQDGRAVVEQALRIDQRDQPRRRLAAGASWRRPPPDRSPRRSRPTTNASSSGSPVAMWSTIATTAAHDEHAGDRQQRHAAERSPKLVAVESIGGLEDETREQEVTATAGRDLDHVAAQRHDRDSSPTTTIATVYGRRRRPATNAISGRATSSATRSSSGERRIRAWHRAMLARAERPRTGPRLRCRRPQRRRKRPRRSVGSVLAERRRPAGPEDRVDLLAVRPADRHPIEPFDVLEVVPGDLAERPAAVATEVEDAARRSAGRRPGGAEALGRCASTASNPPPPGRATGRPVARHGLGRWRRAAGRSPVSPMAGRRRGRGAGACRSARRPASGPGRRRLRSAGRGPGRARS